MRVAKQILNAAPPLGEVKTIDLIYMVDKIRNIIHTCSNPSTLKVFLDAQPDPLYIKKIKKGADDCAAVQMLFF